MTRRGRGRSQPSAGDRCTASASYTPAAATASSSNDRRHDNQGPNLVSLALNFDPPGLISANGPRHDNDHTHIKDIQIVPTQVELTCERTPFLPSNDVPGAPHHLPPGWSRLLDTHFRLNREDMIDQLRKGIVIFLEALRKTAPNRQGDLLSRNKMRQLLGQDVGVNAYRGIEFLEVNIDGQRRGSVRVSFDQPHHIKDKKRKERKTFWEESRRRLVQNTLVCFIYPAEGQGGGGATASNSRELRISLGVIHTRDPDEMASNDKKAIIHVTMSSNTDYCQFVRAIKNKVISPKDVFMVESMGGHFESYRPILQALQMIDPAAMPFGKYLAPPEEVPSRSAVTLVDPPRYALAPDFEFDLSVLLQSRARCHLNVANPRSRQLAVAALREYSTCDDTQSQALVDSLCREVALIRGPPGTGKTKIGVDLMRVLTHNAHRMRSGPILCICYSDHALDQFLEHLLDQGINRMVRIGSRSPERLRQYNLYELVQNQHKSARERTTLNQAHKKGNATAQSLHIVDKDLHSLQPSAESILRVVSTENEERYHEFERGHRATIAGDQKKTAAENYRLWSSCRDINGQAGSSTSSDGVLPVPNTRRPLHQLHAASLWTMSRWERNLLITSWAAKAGSVEDLENSIQTSHTELMTKMQECSKGVEEGYDTIRRNILSRAQIIGVTTYGAAKHQNLITTLKPKIVICEEAGEVLESHILTALSGSTEHVILIGDHLQLRPKVCSYELSSESHQGRQYNLNRSLFERLVVAAKVPSSLLTTQRRMRPEICSMVRCTLYPELVDGLQVFTYPDVPGMAANVFFMSHNYPEDSRDEYLALSASNTFEAEMVKALVMHLLKNGCQPSRIAILTPYIRQLTKLRDTLGGVTNLAIYGRDQELLDEKPVHNDISLTTDSAQADRLTLRTIDNFQGEEADIVIISLVRSSSREDEHGISSTIGFLRSSNRTNVLLSRAKHGMYLIGDAALMDKPQNGIWPRVITELNRKGRIGEGFLLRCRNHPDIEIPPATNPEMFETLMPNGIYPILVLPCGHALTKSTLDSHMRMWEYYERVKNMTSIIYAKTRPLPKSQVSVVGCPSCQVPIVGIRRYGRRIKSTQVALNLKKFETVQATAIDKAEAIFSRNKGIQEMIPLILDGISGLVFTSTQEVIQKNLQAMWQMISGASSSSGSSASSSQQDEDFTAKSGRVLGSFASDDDIFPNSDIGSLFLYDIPDEQEQIWIKLIAPAMRALKAYHEVHRQAIETPNRRLFESCYDFKTKSSVVNSNSVKDVKLMMECCASECGLPPDGHAGSSFVQSIQGRCDVLLLVLHTAMQVFEKICLKVYHDHPSVSGWSRFIEDLLQCCVVHSRILRDAAANGKYYRLEMHAKMSLLDIYLKRMQWLGHRPFDRRNILRKLSREAAVHNTLVQFQRVLQDIQAGDQIDLWIECLPEIGLLDASMEMACKVALGELKYKPASEEVRSEIFRLKQIEFHDVGRRRRCPNGHWYTVGNWWMSLQESTCPDCGTCSSSSIYQLHQTLSAVDS
ncbi:hypothetical protein KVV02_000380 [Mortierella alpina]|uniref:P-loop containing nucleoside triphosphate hydrolase protein n=1 Tax=Mortierella alpina TaxID=64518 RepID=A0A9P8A096_MORAP|nr:hypothetical protein KVV02_000380 [Mortierella alpina]